VFLIDDLRNGGDGNKAHGDPCSKQKRGSTLLPLSAGWKIPLPFCENCTTTWPRNSVIVQGVSYRDYFR
jgi:hypothetical protein